MERSDVLQQKEGYPSKPLKKTIENPNILLKRLRRELSLRGLSVALYRIITADKPVLIVESKQQANDLGQFLHMIINRVYDPAYKLGDKYGVDILFKEEYKQQWKKYGGRALCIVEEEKTVSNPGVDLLEKVLQASINEIYQTLEHIVLTLERIRTYARKRREEHKQIDVSYVGDIIENFTENKQERKIIEHVYQIWGKQDILFENMGTQAFFFL